MILYLPLKKKWFDMTKEDIKPEDYRVLSFYWYSRLCLYRGEKKSQKWWQEYFDNDFAINDEMEFQSFIYNKLTLGYPKSTDNDRIIIRKHLGIEIRTGNPEWGADPNKLYFVIKHGPLLFLTLSME